MNLSFSILLALQVISAIVFGFIAGSFAVLLVAQERSRIYRFYDNHPKVYMRVFYTVLFTLIAISIVSLFFGLFTPALILLVEVVLYIMLFSVFVRKIDDDIVQERTYKNKP